MKSKELREQLSKLVSDMRKIYDAASSEKRDLSADENVNYQNLESEVEKLEARIERADSLEKREKELAQVDPDADRSGGYGSAAKSEGAHKAAFRAFLKGGFRSLSGAQIRTLTQGTDTAGGFLVPDEEFINQLIKKADEVLFIRQLATKYMISGSKAGGIPTLETDFSDCDWTTELGTGSLDNLVFGKRKLIPNALAKRVKISNLLLNNSTMDPESLVIDRLVRKFAVTEEKGFLTGDGSNKPLGLFTASSSGISTSRDVSTDNTSSAVTFDGLINAQESIKEVYQAKAVWLVSRALKKMVRKLKDGQNQYIWEPSTVVGAPSMLLGSPLYTSEFAPATFTTGLYVGIYGDMSFYGIADSIDQRVQRLDELYAETNEVGFIGRREIDGQPLLEEAFARIKLA
jgi:HK97 family phage major capsid protein